MSLPERLRYWLAEFLDGNLVAWAALVLTLAALTLLTLSALVRLGVIS